MSASQFFCTQLGTSRAPSETIQRQALAFGDRTGNIDLLAALASKSDLVEDVDKALAARSELAVLEAWARRPGRSTAEIVARFASEKRATLLARIAEVVGLPDEVYRQVAKSSAITLRWALLANVSVPHDLKVELAADLGARYTTANSSTFDKVSFIKEAPADVASAFIAHTSNTYFLKSMVRNTAPQHVLRAVISRCAVLATSEPGDLGPDAFDIAAASVAADPAGSIREFTYEQMLARFDADPSLERPYGADRLASELDVARRRQDYDASAALARIGSASSASAIVSEIERFRRETRELSLSASHDDIAAHVAKNPHSDAGLISTYLAWLSPDQGREILRRAIARKDLELAVLVMSRFSRFGEDLFSEAYRASSDPEEFLLWSLGESKVAPAFVTHAAVVGADKDLAFRLLPIASTLSSRDLAPEAEKLIVGALGDDQGLWLTFETLASEWDGSLTDLLSTVVSFGTA